MPPSSPDAPSSAPPNGSSTPRILIVVLNYRTPALTIECLRSVGAEVLQVAGVKCVVVDNASGDDSVSQISKAIADEGWASWCELLVSDSNRGFAGGNNVGIAHGEPAEFVLLLNSDTIVHPGCLQRCLDVMAEQPRAGVMSCRVLNRDGSIQNSARRFPTPLRAICCSVGLPWQAPRWFGWADAEDPGWDRATTARDVDWLGGAFLFVRAEVFDGRVRLDEDFFFYGEDVAFGYRVHELGWNCHYDPVASITHLGGASSDPSRMPASNRSSHQWRARYLVQSKHNGALAALGLRCVDVTVTTARLAQAALAGPAQMQRATELGSQLGMILTTRIKQ